MRTSEERSERILKKYRAERPKYVRRRIAAISLLCCVVIVGLVLFVPYGETPMPLLLNTKSEYYDVINSIHLYRHQSRTANNNFEAWFLGLGDSGGQTGAGNGGEGGDGNDYGSLDTLGSRYEETTDNQVNGVIEGDLIKRSDRYVYFFSGDTLYVYDIAGEDTKCVGTYSVGAEIRLENDWCQFDWGSAEIFLSSDVCTVTLVINVYEGDCCSGHTKTYLISLDVRDPAAITKLTCVAIDGRKETVRMIDDALLLVSRYELGDVTFRDPGTFVPTYEKNGKVSLVAPENIVMPELLSVPRYTTVALLDESTLDLRSFAAAYSSFGSVYVSENAVYVTQCDAAQTKHEDKTMDSRYFTEIAVMDYDAEHLTARGSFCVDGFIGSKYAMNEKNGILRVVTTVQYGTYLEKKEGFHTSYVRTKFTRYASLSCFDLRTLEKVGGVDKFADGEEVKSVCFRDDTAYVCSAHGSFYLINSVSVLDLSDPNRVTVKDNGSIKGYSTSLVALPNGDFLGIGFDGGNRFLKVEVYRQTEDGVASVAVYQRPNISYVSNSRTFLIDRENGYFGIPIHDIGRHESAFVLLSYDGERLTEQLTVPYETGSSNCVRGLLIDGYFYLFTWNGAFSAIPFPTGEPS